MAPKIFILLIATSVLANLVNSRVNATSTRTEVKPAIYNTSQNVDSNNDNSEIYNGGETILKQIESLAKQSENKSSVVDGSDASEKQVEYGARSYDDVDSITALTKSALEKIAEAKETIDHRIDNNTFSVSTEGTQSNINKFHSRVNRKRRINNRANAIRSFDQNALEEESDEVMDEIPENIEDQLLSYDNSKSEDYEYENGDETQNETVPAKSKRGNKNVPKGKRGNGKGKTTTRKPSKRPNHTTRKFTPNRINKPSNNKGRGGNSKNKGRGRGKHGKKN